MVSTPAAVEADAAMERGEEGARSEASGASEVVTGRSERRQVSLMDDVRARIGDLQSAAAISAAAAISMARKSFKTPRSAAAAAAAARREEEGWAEDGVQPKCGFSFRTAIIGAITLAALLSCAGMFGLLVFSTGRIQQQTSESCSDAVEVQEQLISRLVFDNVTLDSYSSILTTLTTMVIHYVKDPPDQAVDALWNTMRTWNKFGSPVSGNSALEQRQQVIYAAWTSLTSQWRLNWGRISDRVLRMRSEPHVDALYVSYLSEEVMGARYSMGISVIDEGLPARDTPESQFPYPTAYAIDVVAGNDTLQTWELNAAGDRVGPRSDVARYVATARPYFRVQEDIRNRVQGLPQGAESAKAVRAWSEVYKFSPSERLGMTWTAPVAYCGNYSCFEGVVAADVTLDHVSADLAVRWDMLRAKLSREFNFDISQENSSIFIVNHVSGHHPGQQGMLIAASHASAATLGHNLTWAEHSPQEVVRTTAMAIKDHYGQWDAEALQHGVQDFAYRVGPMREAVPRFVGCRPLAVSESLEPDCRRVATLSVALGLTYHWLVVVVLPIGAFSDVARERSSQAHRKVDKINEDSQRNVQHARIVATLIVLGMVALSMGFGLWLGCLVSRPLVKLGKLMRRLGELDFAHESQEWAELRRGRRSHVRDVGRLQNTFWSLSRGIEAFARFVPETVVRNIVLGDPRSTRLHVSRREVTIMFSDIRDFTAISEALSQRDLLFVLTRYLSVMTRIVEIFDGVVAEVLGDGLLAFWNTPDDVEDHAAKACAAALAMQQALVLLNAELAKLNLSQLSIRIGVHTGEVLSGNIGSETKMKFGCLGDPVNTASRLEGLCKFYGVGIMCSAATREQLPGSMGFFCRRLDLVQVKGKVEPMTIYEVIGRDCDPGQVQCNSSLAIGAGAAASSAALADAAALGAERSSGRRKMTLSSVWAAVLSSPSTLFARTGSERQCRKATSTTAGTATSSAGDDIDHVETGESTGRMLVWPPKDMTITQEQRARASLYEAALSAFQEARFGEAREQAARLLEETPDDLAARTLLRRAQEHAGPDGTVVGLTEEELTSWTGVMTMGEK